MSEHNGLAVEDAAPKRGGTERRAARRCSCKLVSACQPIPLPTASQSEVSWHGTIDDISQGGVKMTLRRRFEVDTPLIVELSGTNQDTTITVASRVAHVSPKPGGGWIIGCQFNNPLNEEDLKALL